MINLILLLIVLGYLLAALVHHLRDKTLHLDIVIEYILLAALALVIFQGLLLS